MQTMIYLEHWARKSMQSKFGVKSVRSEHQAHQPLGKSDSYANITIQPVDFPPHDDDSTCIVYYYG